MWHIRETGEMHTGFWWGDLRERDHLDEPGVNKWEDKIKMDLQQVGWSVMDWITVAQDRDRWQAVEKAVMNLWIL